MSNLALSGADAMPAALHRLLREWSDPVCHAHANWLDDLPVQWHERLYACAPARRALANRLRARVPLQPLTDPEQACARAGWALTDESGVMATIEHIGWSVLQPWVARTVARADIECIVACVGTVRHEAALRHRPVFLSDSEVLAPLPRGASPAQLQGAMQSLGWAVLMEALDGPLMVLRAHVRLVAGAHLDAPDSRVELPVHIPALLDHLAVWSKHPEL